MATDNGDLPNSIQLSLSDPLRPVVSKPAARPWSEVPPISSASHGHDLASVGTSTHQLASTYIGESGFIPVFQAPVEFLSAPNQQAQSRARWDTPPTLLRDSFLETFEEYCYTWCPVLDKSDYEANPEQPPILANALAVAASRIKPPLIQHSTPEEYYDRVKTIFYGGGENCPINCIKAMMLLYWWNPLPPSLFSIDSTWWWTGMAIRIGQEIGLHRELEPSQQSSSTVDPRMRRRIWWTLFVRLMRSCSCLLEANRENPGQRTTERIIPGPTMSNQYPRLQHSRTYTGGLSRSTRSEGLGLCVVGEAMSCRWTYRRISYSKARLAFIFWRALQGVEAMDRFGTRSPQIGFFYKSDCWV